MQKILLIIGLVVLFLVIGYWAYYSMPEPEPRSGSAPTGAATNYATTSLITLSNTASRDLFATSTGCTARIITTSSTPVRIKMGDHAEWTLSNSRGIFQPASTTQTYDSGLYGCGLWTAVATGPDGEGATQPSPSALVTEFRGFQ